MSAEPYTSTEADADLHDWAWTTPEQRHRAFSRLLGIATARASLGDAYAIQTLREIRAERNGGQS